MNKNFEARGKNDDLESTQEKRDKNPRITIHQHFPTLSDRDVEAVRLFQEMLDEKILDIKREGNYTNQDMYDLLGPFLSGPNVMSKIRIDSEDVNIADRRHVNLELAAAMNRVFGVSLDEILDELFQYLPPRTIPPKK